MEHLVKLSNSIITLSIEKLNCLSTLQTNFLNTHTFLICKHKVVGMYSEKCGQNS